MNNSESRPCLSWSDQDTVIHLWHELMEFPASSPQEALEHCLRALARQIGAVNAIWVGAAREKDWERRNPFDPLLGWRPHICVTLYPTDAWQRAHDVAMDAVRHNYMDPQTVALASRFGQNRCIYLSYLMAAALVPIPSIVYAIGWSCPALLLAAARPVFFFALARRPVPWVFWILISVASVVFILPVDVCAFLPPASALWLEAFRVRYMLAPGNVALMFTSAAPFFAFWPYSRITRRMWPLAALCFLFGAIVIAFFAVRATGLVNIPGIPNLVSRWGSTVSETEAVVVLCVMATLFALLFLDQRKVADERATLAGELLAAREIQRLLVPARLDVARCLRIEAAFRPAQEVGGDFYRCRVLSSGIQRILLGDVSGKGAAAAMTASLLLGAAEGHDPDSPAALLNHLNRAMLAGNVGGFATCLCADISPSGSVTMANAGHLPPYLNGQELALPPALPLGVSVDAEYAEAALQLTPGDTLTFLSDGVVEAQSPAGELFGFDRTRAITTQPAEQIARAAQAFGQQDDITVLTLQFAPAEVLHA